MTGPADDLSDVRAALAGQRRVLQAIGTTQGQHTGILAELGGQLDAVTAAVERIRTDHGTKLDQIVTMLGHLADDDRGQDPA